ncbi:MAG: hypothetical protein JNL65_00185 [Saprospiraceae bacterium]|nr:hypothetical protein [Saprospiraceae bacterium]
MKAMQIMYFVILFCCISCTQNTSKNLDGKSYQISSWDINHPEKQDPDIIVFKNNSMDSESCHQYGFVAAPYHSTYKDGVYSFSSTIKSNTEGEMQFNGTVKDQEITGSFVWKKAGQADINYAFKGNLKN